MHVVDEIPDVQDKKRRLLDALDQMSQLEMARLWRFAPPGHPYFSDPELFAEFEKKFAERGGMTPAISKKLGW